MLYFLKRFAVHCIDDIIFNGLALFVFSPKQTHFIEQFMFTLFPVLLHIYTIHTFEATLGQYLFGLRVVNIHTHEKPPFTHLVKRFISFDIIMHRLPFFINNDIFAFVLYYTHALNILMDPNMMGWHEYLSNTKSIST